VPGIAATLFGLNTAIFVCFYFRFNKF